MIIYHGSNTPGLSEFNYDISRSSNPGALERFEGPGWYCALNKEISRNFGCFLYTLEFNSENYFDSTDRKNILKMLKECAIRSKRVDYLNEVLESGIINELIDKTQKGKSSSYRLYELLNQILGNDEYFWDGSDEFVEEVERYLSSVDAILSNFDTYGICLVVKNGKSLKLVSEEKLA
jgi:hypothetical protein